MTLRKTISTLLASLILIIGATARSSTAPVLISNPVLVLQGEEPFSANRKQWIRYIYFVENFADFPKELFAAAPSPAVWDKHQGLPHVGRFLRFNRKKAQWVLRVQQTR